MDVDGSWHAFGRNQNLTLHDLPKLGVAATVRRLELAPDPTGDVYFHNVRVNGILLDENAPPFWYVLALLNSRLLDFIFRRGAARHANGYYAANKQFIAPLPIQRGTPAAVEQLAELGRTLHSLSTQITRERDGFGRWLRGELGTEHTLPDAFDRYEAVDDETLLAALRQHRRHHTTDPSSRAFRERFVTELGASRERLAGPLRDTAARDVEADAAVYDLYELTNAQRLLIDAEYEATSASESTP